MSRTYALILFVISVPLCVGGAYLVRLGGSPYYLVAGGMTALGALGIWLRKTEGALLYLALLLLTLPWALWEAGLDGWALMARLLAPIVLGLPLLIPAVRRPLQPLSHWGRRWTGRPVMIGICALTLVLGGIALAVRPADPFDPMYQTGMFEGPIPPLPRTGHDAQDADWLHYGGDAGGTRFSRLDQITPANVGMLREAWRVRIGPTSGLEATPIKVGQTLYVCNAYNDVIALDAETGRQRWRFNAGVKLDAVPYTVCRGVAYYKAPQVTGECAERILTNTIDARLIALDARTGRPCSTFGHNGQVALVAGLSPEHTDFYAVTSAPTLVRGKVVLGGWVSDGMQWGEPAGVVRAFDAVTGELAWAWDIGRPDRQTLPPPGENYTHSTPNAWAPFSADETLGLVYVPTGNPAVDYFGGYRRPFDEKFGSSVTAIDAQSGKTRWTFQTVHHDLWDWDNASQPTLIELPTARGVRPALIQPTKRGELFVLDRLTGKPLKPVQERPVPQGGIVPGERLSPTQPFSVGMPSFRGPDLTEKSMWGVTPIDQLWCRIRFREARYEGTATPPGFRPTIAYPGFNGGMDWGSVSVDPIRHLLFVNSNRVPNYDRIVTRDDAARERLIFGKKHGALNAPQFNTPYVAIIKVFMSPLAIPCNQPPYGMLAAVDIRSGKLVWSQPFGTAREAGPLGLRSKLPFTIGTPNNGGSLVTGSGLLFIGATQDSAFRAIEAGTGKLLWQANLGAGGQATPVTYISPKSGRQFVAIAAGGNPILGSVLGDYVVAYTLGK
ncbi:membrane-bound PQQ-dependent dehydrogenase, glucose/quinate/shikimate family [Sphingobium sp. Sx8-8]|uniref:membrane-bound PQQ-dependent dehydrogenase, glucose/quinate/shikimate family n=1 Tax=Sphingobium sp. Sx8-8 TaxID=2933617 RepID=UPI001F56F826|nr:membrane-bound PQQ-dependent dehydrogenase, glucose/quinate/shikimate family [Sphingobium sp. Sx8-8]